ncbi:uncharacterized protein LOC131174129 [Hevea brasiliensis]|uniref:uncharacterized protein LOC131174129 n=1 Tax=Hevea brasiliensis TaxID=3981 RepID=UPI0025F748FD|nr:uncharacterized protein LOC131174129 [Hevea brasiliensis]
MARTKRKILAAAAAASPSSSSSEELPIAALKKKLKEKKKIPKTESTSISSNPSKEVEPAVTAPDKKKGRKMRGIDIQRKKGAAKSSGSVVDKALLDCKFIKWDNFDQVDFQFKELFEFQEWMNVCECTDIYYPRLVQEFYRTLKVIDEEDRFEVFLNDRVYDISVELIAKALKLPNDGNRISAHKDVARVSGFNLTEFESEVFPTNTVTSEKSTSTKAFHHIKIIHSMVNYIFCPKSGSYGYLSYLDMCIMWHIVNRVRMNLAYLIFKNMCKAYGIGKLPYAHLLIALFRELEINVSKESSRADLIVLREIHSNTNGRKKRFEKSGSFKAKVDSDSPSEIMSELQGLRAFINEKFSTTNQYIELLRKFVDILDYKAQETNFATKVETDVPAGDPSTHDAHVFNHGNVECEGTGLGESTAAVEHEREQVVEPAVEPVVEHVSEQVVEPVVEPAVELESEQLVEPVVESTQKKEDSLKDQQESAPPKPSAAEASQAKKGKKRVKSTVSNPYQTLVATLQTPSDEDEPQEHEPLADQVSQPPAAKPSRKKMVPSKAIRRSKRLNV